MSSHVNVLSAIPAAAFAALVFQPCISQGQVSTMKASAFGHDVQLLREHTDAVVLRRGEAGIVIVPQYQGRVMTATAAGDGGPSSGWINHDLVKQGVVPQQQAEGTLDEHMYAFGGEERFWMGPEGGQYSIFFAPGTKFEFDDWFTPDAIDNEPWKLVERSDNSVTLTHSFELQNHSGTRFNVRATRQVDLLSRPAAAERLGEAVPEEIKLVAYRSNNQITNTGTSAWTKESGLLSIWMLCMFKPSLSTTVFVPFKVGPEAELGRVVADDYFGKVPADRLKVDDGVVYFKCDGKQRGKIGFTPQRATGIAGSYDPEVGRLTLLLYEQPEDHEGYVNSKWQYQDAPYRGDAINSYNDGPVDDSGEQMGPFYELESSSPALALESGESARHSQTVMHLYGEQDDLQQVLHGLCDVKLAKVAAAFGN